MAIGRDISFFTDGLRIAGTLFEPDAGPTRPGIVMCQGAIGQRQFFRFPDIARRLAELGHTALTFDHRGFGESEGERGRCFQLEQVQDIRDAMSFLATQPTVDPDQIALFGTSIGGGNVVYAGAVDERARWVISVVGFGDGIDMALGGTDAESLLTRIADDRLTRVAIGTSQLIPRSSLSVRNEITAETRKRVVGGGDGANSTVPDLTLESVERLIEFKPADLASRIAPRPVLFITAENDEVTPAAGVEAMYRRAEVPKAHEVLLGLTHYEVYEEPHLSKLVSLAYNWIRER